MDRRQKVLFIVWAVLVLLVLPGLSYLLARMVGG
jgi:hypothetical protein